MKNGCSDKRSAKVAGMERRRVESTLGVAVDASKRPTFVHVGSILPGKAMCAYRERTVLVRLAFLWLDFELVFPLLGLAVSAVQVMLALHTQFATLHQMAHELFVGLDSQALGGQEAVLDVLEHGVQALRRGNGLRLGAIGEDVLDKDGRRVGDVRQGVVHGGGRGGRLDGGLDALAVNGRGVAAAGASVARLRVSL